MIVELEEGAIFEKGTEYSEGYDLVAMESVMLPPGAKQLISSGVKVKFPMGYWGLLTHRSGFGAKTDGMILLGIIDNDYRGTIKMNVFNGGNDLLRIQKGDRIGQLVLMERVLMRDIKFGTVTNDTRRGSKGFGEATKET